MSDRFVLQTSKADIEHQFDVATERDDFFEPNFNITAGSLVPVVYREGGERKIYQFRWGLIPENADDEREGTDHYEYHIEQLSENEWLTECVEQRRCLIPASGFYKWKATDKKSTPFYIRLLSNGLMAFGGIYSVWKSSLERNVYSCAILTTEANALIQPVDDRMPVIIKQEDYEQWLSKIPLKETALTPMFEAYSMTELAVNRVSEEVNDSDNNNPSLIQPIPK